jgi:predicted nucleic acid-binding protein
VKVVANSGPLMALGKLGLLDLLGYLYGQVYIPSAVYNEVIIRGLEHGYSDAYAARLAIQRGTLVVVAVENSDLPNEISGLPLDVGEKQSLYLAIREKADLVLFDDFKAREEAGVRGITTKGTLGIISQAYRSEWLNLGEVESLIQSIIMRDDIWIAEELCRRVYAALKEEEKQDGGIDN